MMFLYSFGLLAAIVLTLPYWLIRMVRSGRYREGLLQRLGAVPQGLRAFTGGCQTIWIHAVSVGEVLAASRLIELLDGLDSELPVVISTTTRTGQALARERFDGVAGSAARVFYFPLDFGWVVRRYLRALRPRMLILMESELWPRVLAEACRSSLPVAVVNGRVSNRSLPKYRALRAFWRPFLGSLRVVLAQSALDAQRFVEIGVPAERVRVAGNLKFDVRTSGDFEIKRMLREALPESTRLLVAGSTLEGEEDAVLLAFQELCKSFPDVVLALAPRHPERFRDVEKKIEAAGLSCSRRSDWKLRPEQIPPGGVFLLDSIGELASVYSLASVAFVGGSLIPAGGHNPLEPAQFGKPIVMGPYADNFRGMVAALLEKEAIRVTPPERLAEVIAELLESSDSAAMGARARKVFEEHAGASLICFNTIRDLLTPDAAGDRKNDESLAQAGEPQ
jgi:3-deoxy-D-manno-octulosonic-acid transferase